MLMLMLILILMLTNRHIEIEHDFFSYSRSMLFDVAVRFQSIEHLHTALSYLCGMCIKCCVCVCMVIVMCLRERKKGQQK